MAVLLVTVFFCFFFANINIICIQDYDMAKVLYLWIRYSTNLFIAKKHIM